MKLIKLSILTPEQTNTHEKSLISVPVLNSAAPQTFLQNKNFVVSRVADLVRCSLKYFVNSDYNRP